MSVIWNPISKLEKEKGKKYKILTIHVLEKNLIDFTKKLNIEKIKPIRQKKGDLLKDIKLLNLPEYKNQDEPLEMNPKFHFIIMSDKDRDELNRLLKTKISQS